MQTQSSFAIKGTNRILTELLTLLCFKIADLLNVIEMNDFDIDEAAKTVGVENAHTEWVEQFLQCFAKLHRYEHVTEGQTKLSKPVEQLVRLLVDKRTESDPRPNLTKQPKPSSQEATKRATKPLIKIPEVPEVIE